MTCFHPFYANKLTFSNGTVKVNVIRQATDEDLLASSSFQSFYNGDVLVQPILLPCKQCSGCKLERSRTWAVRCIHESQMWSSNAFITLTYDNNHLPPNNSLVKRDLQLFWKRLRKQLDYYGLDSHIRYFACGEYGTKFQRPHYHACVFNFWPDDSKLWSIRSGSRLFVSPMISKVWPYGFHSIGDVTFESAAYVARYVLKKINGKNAVDHYQGREPEFVVMSRRPGIGHDWLIKYHEDVYGDGCTIPDRIVVRDKFYCRPPEYYDSIYDKELDGDIEYLKNLRADRSYKFLSTDDLHRKEMFTELDLLQNSKRRYED